MPSSVALLLVAHVAATPPTYTLVDLGLLPGWDFGGEANAISPGGAFVVGTAFGPANQTRPWFRDLSSGGAMINIGTLGGAYGRGLGVGDSMIAVGSASLEGFDPLPTFGFAWLEGAMSELPPVAGDLATAEDITSETIIAGSSSTRPGVVDPQVRAAIWIGGKPIALPTIDGRDALARGISDGATVVGALWVTGGIVAGGTQHAAAWFGEPMAHEPPIDLGTLGGANSEAQEVAELGTIVGWAEDDLARQRPFRIDRALDRRGGESLGSMVDLGTLGGEAGAALSVNNAGTIVGWSENAMGEPRATAWIDGAIVDLTAAAGAGSDAVLVEARDISETGAIVGWGWFGPSTRAENRRGFALVPIPPSPADLDGDGAVNGADLGILLGAWGSCRGLAACAGDLTRDGVVDGGDLGALLAAWTG